MDSIAR